MAKKRMFSLSVIDTDAFLEMPCSTQALYFHLCMRADDDGFVASPKIITRTIGASEDDFKLLIAKRFILLFEDGVIVIKHWRMHNTISRDRYIETSYTEDKKMLRIKPNNAYTLGDGAEIDDTKLIEASKRQTHNRRAEDAQETRDRRAQYSIGKSSIDKDSIEEVREEEDREEKSSSKYQLIVDMYNDTCVSFPRVKSLSDMRKAAIRARLKRYTIEDFRELFTLAESSDFLKGSNAKNWSATFDWLIKDSNFAKVLDGNYNNKDHNGNNVPISDKARELEAYYKMDAEWAMKGELNEYEADNGYNTGDAFGNTTSYSGYGDN